MKHVFIINSIISGKDKIKEEIKSIPNIDYEIYETKCQGDAERFVKEYPNKTNKIRFYSCGGDGILNEVVNGIYGSESELALIPYGTGNDFAKNFGGKKKLRDIKNLINSQAKKIDCMQINDRYGINIINFGFDATVGEQANNIKKNNGCAPYIRGFLSAVCCSRNNKIKVEVDGELLNTNGKLTCCSLGNGQWVGGQFRVAPLAEVDDGFIEVCILKTMCLCQFFYIVPPYKRGEHLLIKDNPTFKNIMIYKRTDNVHIFSEKSFGVCIDGEMIYSNNFNVKVCPHSINFVVPNEISIETEEELENKLLKQ